MKTQSEIFYNLSPLKGVMMAGLSLNWNEMVNYNANHQLSHYGHIQCGHEMRKKSENSDGLLLTFSLITWFLEYKEDHSIWSKYYGTKSHYILSPRNQ